MASIRIKTLAIALFALLILQGMHTRPLLCQDWSPESDEISLSRSSQFLWKTVKDVKYQGGYVYLLMINGLQIYHGGIDFSTPELVKQLEFDNTYNDLHVEGDFAVLISRYGLMSFVDISQPEAAVRTFDLQIADTVFDYVTYEDYGYLACGFGGVHVLDQSDPYDIRIVRTIEEGAHMVAAAVYDDILYVSDDFNGLIEYHIDSPLLPVFEKVSLFSRPIKDLSLRRNMAYLAYGDSGIVAHAIESSGALRRVMRYPTLSSAQSVRACDNALLASDMIGNVYVFDYDTTAARYISSERDVDDNFDFGVSNDREYLFLPDRRGGLDVVSVDPGIEPILVWFYPGSSLVSSVALAEDFAVVSGSNDYLSVWKLGQENVPELVSTFRSAAGDPQAVRLDSIVIVTDNSLQDASFVHILGLDDQSGELRHEKSFLAVSDPFDIKAEFSSDTTIDLTVAGKFGTTVTTIGLPLEPPEDVYYALGTGTATSGFVVTAAEWNDGFLYTCALKGGGNQIYDATELGNNDLLVSTASFDVKGRINVIEIIDTICYLAGSRGLQVCAMDSFMIGSEIGSYFEDYDFYDLEFNWPDSLMFAAMGGEGLGVFDISDLSSPDLLLLSDTPGFAEKVDALENSLAVADRHSVLIYDYFLKADRNQVIIPSEYYLEQNYPNPFNAVTRIDFGIPGELSTYRDVQLKVINILGQTVRTLVNQKLGPGLYSYTWDGTDYSGSRVASGLYFYRLSIDDSPQTTRKMVLLK